jgi:hypothetical protein
VPKLVGNRTRDQMENWEVVREAVEAYIGIHDVRVCYVSEEDF